MKQGKLLILDRKVNSHKQLRTVRRVFNGLLGSVFLLGSLHAAAEAYRWTDDSGQVIFSQTPPQDDRPYSRLGEPPPPADAEREKARLEAIQKSLDETRDTREKRREETQRTAQQQAEIDKNCATARTNLEALRTGSTRRFRLEDGSVRRLTSEERQARMETAEAYIQKNCQDPAGK